MVEKIGKDVLKEIKIKKKRTTGLDSANVKKIYEVLQNAERPLTMKEIAEKSGLKHYITTKNALFHLLASHKVKGERVGGTWLFWVEK